MKYFEVHTPYYALLQAETKESAIEKYVKFVADDEDDSLKDKMEEVDRDYALVKFSRAPEEENKMLMPINTVLEDFNCKDNEVLLIDGALI